MITSPGRVLVTGGTGFVGGAVVAALTARGTSVAIATRQSSESSPELRYCRIGDVGPGTDWRDALSGCDAVVHLAARVHLMDDRSADPAAEYRRVNVAGSLALARQAAAAGVRRLVFVSSIKVNGEETRPGAPFHESDTPAPVDPYGVSKYEAELGLLAFAAASGMEVVVVRPPLVYGPGVRANFLRMAEAVAHGTPLPLGRVNANLRSLVGLRNLTSLLMTCLDHPQAANEVFLVSDGEDLSTTELLRRTAAALGVRPRLLPVPITILRAVAMLAGRRALLQRLTGSLQVDITKARQRLGWVPQFTVDQELVRVVAGLMSAGGTQ